MSNPKTSKTPTPKTTPAKPREKDMRPGHVIFAERFNEELRLMDRRYANLRSLAAARKAHGTPGQVEAGIKWMEAQLAEVATALRESVNRAQDESGGKPAFKPVVPSQELPAETPAVPASG